MMSISIHALREEGDGDLCFIFLQIRKISIHALREEGDIHSKIHHKKGIRISIHALREEGDLRYTSLKVRCRYFYPRPPRGGRPFGVVYSTGSAQFLSTPSARRATKKDRRR